MRLKAESYPEKIRRIADELNRLRGQYDVDRSVEKLRLIANELELGLRKPALKK